MYKDEILAEVWRNRDAYAEEHHHSLDEMVADLQARQKRTHGKMVDRRDRVETSSRSCSRRDSKLDVSVEPEQR